MNTEIKTNDYAENLVLKIRECDEDATDQLYEQFSPLIHKEINSFKKKALILGIDFQDLVQEAMLGFSYAINNFNENETKFITFATICIRRKLLNYIGKFETGKSKVLSDTVSLDESIGDDKIKYSDAIRASDIVDPLNNIINNETIHELVYTMREKLSENERMALTYDVEGKSIDEIAELMNMSNKQIYNLIFRARKKCQNVK